MNALDNLLGPLATVECQRAVRPRWVPWVRMLAGIPTAGAAIVVLWVWMLWGQIDPGFHPGSLLTGGLVAAEVAQVFLALLLSPALVAGAIAGEKDRGTLAMLLASRLNTSDIIFGRLVGSFSQVALILAAGVPPLLLLAALCHTDLYQMLLLVALPVAVALGSAGLSVATSTLAKRGRDALLTVYVMEVLLIITGYFVGGQISWLYWLGTFNPFAVVYPLAAFGDLAPAAITVAVWLGMGTAGTAIAIWQLRPTYLRQTGGESRGRRERRHRVPRLTGRPMLWKELYLERSSSFGAFGMWLIRLITALLAGGGLALFVAIAWQGVTGDAGPTVFIQWLAEAIGFTSTLILWLAQWILGLRAFGVVATERQRSTWDAILASDLEAKEIIVAKALGSIFGLRWMIAAMCLAWTATMLAGGMTLAFYCNTLTKLAAGGAFMVVAGLAVGVAMNAAGNTRGMAASIALWMASAIVTAMLAFLVAAVAMAFGMALWATYVLATITPDMLPPQPSFLGWLFPLTYAVLRLGLYLLATVATGMWLAANFDRLAGRMGSWSISQRVVQFFDALTEPAQEVQPSEPQTVDRVQG